jgi:hypothetical protein
MQQFQALKNENTKSEPSTASKVERLKEDVLKEKEPEKKIEESSKKKKKKKSKP